MADERIQDLLAVPRINRELVYLELTRYFERCMTDAEAAAEADRHLVADSLRRTARAIDLLGQLCMDPVSEGGPDFHAQLPKAPDPTALAELRAQIQRRRDQITALEGRRDAITNELYRDLCERMRP